jgi:hypothetical protein
MAAASVAPVPLTAPSPLLVGKEWDFLTFVERQDVKAGRGHRVAAMLRLRYERFLRVEAPYRTLQGSVLAASLCAPMLAGRLWLSVGAGTLAALWIACMVAFFVKERHAYRDTLRRIEEFDAARIQQPD